MYSARNSCTKLEFLGTFSEKKTPQIPNFIQNRPVGAELFHAGRGADGKADMTKLNSRLSKFCEHPYKLTPSSQTAPSYS
jgi:hypothetical protein